MMDDQAVYDDVQPSTDLIVIPGTGEALSLDGPVSDLARALDDVRQLEHNLRRAKQAVSDELHRRMDLNRAWTVQEGGYKVSGESDAPKVEWDAERLCNLLDAMVEEGVITRDAADNAVETSVAYKVKQAGVNALLKNPKLAERIGQCGRTVPVEERQRRVRVVPV